MLGRQRGPDLPGLLDMGRSQRNSDCVVALCFRHHAEPLCGVVAELLSAQSKIDSIDLLRESDIGIGVRLRGGPGMGDCALCRRPHGLRKFP